MKKQGSTQEEQIFETWLEMLEADGFVEHIERDVEPFHLADPIYYVWREQMKTKVKDHVSTFMQGVTYKPDFKFKLTEDGLKALSLCSPVTKAQRARLPFVGHDKEIYVDTKGTFTARANTSDISAPIKIKWVHQLYKKKVYLVKPGSNTGIFKQTFAPNEVLYKLNGEVRVRKKKLLTSIYQTYSEWTQWLLEQDFYSA